jgi:hypothetical protein
MTKIDRFLRTIHDESVDVSEHKELILRFLSFQDSFSYTIESIETYIDEHDLKSRSRKQEKLYPRYYLMVILQRHFKLSSLQIGSMFNRDHSSVLHAVNECENLLETKDKTFLRLISDVKEVFPEYISSNNVKLCEIYDFKLYLSKADMEKVLLYKDRHDKVTDYGALKGIVNDYK